MVIKHHYSIKMTAFAHHSLGDNAPGSLSAGSMERITFSAFFATSRITRFLKSLHLASVGRSYFQAQKPASCCEAFLKQKAALEQQAGVLSL